MRILGIDPGSVVCGYGVIDAEGNKFTLVEYGVIEAKKKYADFPKRLKEIHIRIAEEIKRTNPDEVALETMKCRQRTSQFHGAQFTRHKRITPFF
jgi:crossover junction endodeoxyribonuclease RuvC